MKKRIIILVAIGLLLSFSSGFAGWQDKPELQWQQLYRYDRADDDHQLYTNRISSAFTYLDDQKNPLFKVTPFFEIRRNIDVDLWERKELGVEVGKDIFDWLYIGEAIQGVWMNEDYRDYRNYEKRDYAESETRVLLRHDIFSGEKMKLKGFMLNEFIYDFDDNEGLRNEVVIGLIMPIGQYIEGGINWRHIDRIHYYDSDTVEASATLIF
ncbi:hypothetical protein ACFL1K_02800 [Candidatus Omnitrophota bacterium]